MKIMKEVQDRAKENENNLINRLEAKSSNYFNYFSCRDYSFRSVVADQI
jgi:hypothetical protein